MQKKALYSYFNSEVIKAKKRAFTLIELIVVITILVILGTIAFIHIQGYLKDTKDAKIKSDLGNLYKKMTLENTTTSYSEMVIENQKNELRIDGKDTEGIQGVINFGKLREDPNLFKDSKGNDYIAGYTDDILITNSIGKSALKSFIQLAGISEKNGNAIVVGNYYEIEPGDSPSILREGSGTGKYIVNEGVVQSSPIPSSPGYNLYFDPITSTNIDNISFYGVGYNTILLGEKELYTSLTTTGHTGYGAAILLGNIDYIKRLRIEFDYKYVGTPYGNHGADKNGADGRTMPSFSLNNGTGSSILISTSYYFYKYPYISQFVSSSNFRHVELVVNYFNYINTDSHVLTDDTVLRENVSTLIEHYQLPKTGVNKSSYSQTSYELNSNSLLYLTFYLGDYRGTTRPMNVTAKNIKIYVEVDPANVEAFNASANNAYIEQ